MFTYANGRLHRSTCKRQPANAIFMSDLTTEEQLRQVTAAKAASCCKPKIDAVVQSAHETLAEVASVNGFYDHHVLGENTVRTFKNVAPSYLWAYLGREGASIVAESFGVSAKFNNATQAVTFSGFPVYTVDQASEAVEALWVAAMTNFKAWRKTPEYRELPEYGPRWRTSKRFAAEKDRLINFARDFASVL